LQNPCFERLRNDASGKAVYANGVRDGVGERRRRAVLFRDPTPVLRAYLARRRRFRMIFRLVEKLMQKRACHGDAFVRALVP